MNRGICHVAAIGAVTALSVAAKPSGEQETALGGMFTAQAPEAPNTPIRLRILPLGSFDARGHGFRLTVGDKAAAEKVIAASRQIAGAQDIPFDYDHQTVYGAVPGVGSVAPASGWIDPKSLGVEDDGIYGDVTWTERARTAILSKEYKYLSAVVRHDAQGRISAFTSVALTNTPAVDGLTQLAASSTNPKGPDMDLTALALSLGLPATATLAEILAAQQAQAAALSTAQASIKALNTALGVAEDANQTTALSAATALKAGGDDKTALLTSLQQQVTALSAERHTRILDDAIAAGKIIPAQREQYQNLLRSNETTALSLINSNPAVLKSGAVVSGGQPTGETVTALSAAQKDLCRQLNINEADYLKTLQEEAQ